jgi:hypothetical protein
MDDIEPDGCRETDCLGQPVLGRTAFLALASAPVPRQDDRRADQGRLAVTRPRQV